MNDPHVVSLEYILETDDTLTFDNPDQFERDGGSFTVRIADGVLTATMKDHFATQEQAMAVVWPFLRAWELHHALERGRRELRFTFARSTIMDRKPTPADAGHAVLAEAGMITLKGYPATLTVTRRHYPEPPVGFVVSPDVETLWNRYENHLLGREYLPTMGYFCLSVVQTLYGGRGKAAQSLNIDRPVLDALGLLTSERGDAATARKQQGSALRPLIELEERWIHETLRLMIRRVAMENAGALPAAPLTMADLPTL